MLGSQNLKIKNIKHQPKLGRVSPTHSVFVPQKSHAVRNVIENLEPNISIEAISLQHLGVWSVFLVAAGAMLALLPCATGIICLCQIGKNKTWMVVCPNNPTPPVRVKPLVVKKNKQQKKTTGKAKILLKMNQVVNILVHASRSRGKKRSLTTTSAL